MMNASQAIGPLACTKSDLPGVIRLVDGMMRQGTDQSMLTDYPLVYAEQNLQNIRIIKLHGEVVSVVPFIPHDVVIHGCRFKIGIISPTCTATAHQRKGYALRCLKSCSEGMHTAGCDIAILWTGQNNFRFYGRDGYQVVAHQGTTHRGHAGDAGRFVDHGERVEEQTQVGQAHLEQIRAMHERESCGIFRAPDNYRHLFSLPKLKTLLAFRGTTLVAYLVVGSGVNKPGLVEGGGDKASLETLVHYALSQLHKGEHLDGFVYRTAGTLGDLLQEKLPQTRRPIEEHDAIGWTLVRINNAGSFIRKIAPWLAKRNTAPRREFSIAVHETGEIISLRFMHGALDIGADKLDPHLEMSRTELTSLIFGAYPAAPTPQPEPTRGLFPFHFPVPVLDHS